MGTCVKFFNRVLSKGSLPSLHSDFALLIVIINNVFVILNCYFWSMIDCYNKVPLMLVMVTITVLFLTQVVCHHHFCGCLLIILTSDLKWLTRELLICGLFVDNMHTSYVHTYMCLSFSYGDVYRLYICGAFSASSTIRLLQLSITIGVK